MFAAMVLMAQAVVAVPIETAPRDGASSFDVAANPALLSLVVADAVKQDDPVALCPDRTCTSLFRGSFSKARTFAGPALPESFVARIEMGSPYDTRYRLALVVEQREGKEPLVRAVRGFHYQTGRACFADGELHGIDWKPEGQGISYANGVLCVKE